MQQNVSDIKRHSLTQQADKYGNSHSINSRTSNLKNWDLTFLDTDHGHAANVVEEPVAIELLSSLPGKSPHGTGCVHSYRNVEMNSYKNVDIHVYQNNVFDLPHQTLEITRSLLSSSITDCANHLSENDALFRQRASSDNTSHLTGSKGTNNEIKSPLRLHTEEEAAKLRNSLSTIVRKACPRLSLGSSSPPCSPRVLTKSPCKIAVKFPQRTISDSSRSSLDIKSPQSVGLNISSLSHSRQSSSNSHSPNFIYENIDGDFFGDSDVFDDAQSPRIMRTAREQALPVLFEHPQVWQTVYDSSQTWLSSSRDARSKEQRVKSSQESIYPHSRKPSSLDGSGSGCCIDSGVSSSGSDVLSSRHSPSSLSSELQLDQLSDCLHLEIDVMDAFGETKNHLDNCCVECASRASSAGSSGAIIGTSGLVSPPPVLPLRVYPTSEGFPDPDELRHLELICDRLAVCRFYFGRMSADEARVRLAATSVGTYLLRDSSDPRFKYSISVQTSRGSTSIRVGYASRRFYLDSKPEQMDSIQRFDCILALIQFYARLNASGRSRSPSEETGLSSEHRNGPVVLVKPYEQSGSPSLLHLCRKVINRQLDGRSTTRLCLIPSLRGYLNDYPYDF